MNKPYKFLLVLAVLLLAAMACSSSSSGGSDSSSGGANVLYEDDFSSSNSGWDQYSDDLGSTDYYNGGYRIQILKDTYLFWANPRKDFTDVSVEVDATLIAGQEDNNYGIICRHKDVENFYVLVISSDGYYGIRKRYQGAAELSFIGNELMQFSDEINTGINSNNHLRADCVGSTLTLYANGTQLMSVTDGDIASGDIGLMAGTFSATSSEILFDNFVVRKP